MEARREAVIAAMREWPSKLDSRELLRQLDGLTSRVLTDATARIAELEEVLRSCHGRPHYHCDDSWYCCGKCDHSDHGAEGLDSHAGEAPRTAGACGCGADAWNERIAGVLSCVICGEKRAAQIHHPGYVGSRPHPFLVELPKA